jgi:predicted Zn-dependent protease with MMP-like domain
MPQSVTTKAWGAAVAPSLDDIEALAQETFAKLPAEFRALSEGVIIHVVDFPDEETLEQMNAGSEFDLLGLFRGRGLAHRGASDETGALPNMIWLYRRPLLDFWCEGEDTLGEVVAHVLVHEIGHHFGLSDEDMEAIEASVE